MIYSLQEPPRWTDREVKIQTKKVAGGKMAMIHGDTGEELATFEVEKVTRKLIMTPGDGAGMLKITGYENGRRALKLDKPDEGFWEYGEVAVEDDNGETVGSQKVFRVWHTLGSVVELPVCEAGPECPSDDTVQEIHHQQDMLFSIAVAIKENMHSILTGPTGIGKTTIYRWLANKLGYNLVLMPISRGTQDFHMRGEHMPAGQGLFEWVDGPVTKAVRLSQKHPTLLVFDELNRIGNVAEFSRVYSVLDDTRMIELPEKRTVNAAGEPTFEEIRAGQLYIGATANPVDDDGGDYIGVKELDPAFSSRFKIQPELHYPTVEHEAEALVMRTGADPIEAKKVCAAAKRIREAAEVRFPISFRELEAWLRMMTYMPRDKAAEIAVIQKAHPQFRKDARNLLKLQG